MRSTTKFNTYEIIVKVRICLYFKNNNQSKSSPPFSMQKIGYMYESRGNHITAFRISQLVCPKAIMWMKTLVIMCLQGKSVNQYAGKESHEWKQGWSCDCVQYLKERSTIGSQNYYLICLSQREREREKKRNYNYVKPSRCALAQEQ